MATSTFTNKHLKYGMSPLLGVSRPLIAVTRTSGEKFPISKGFLLLSISHEGKGNATPWVGGEGRGSSGRLLSLDVYLYEHLLLKLIMTS
jgi:hypothetical protein